jgi:hypothetical protein
VLAPGEPLLEPTEPVLVEAAGELVELLLAVPIDVLGDVEPKLLELLNPP